jgi:hypothetical protein
LVRRWFADFPATRQGRPLSNFLFCSSLSDPDRCSPSWTRWCSAKIQMH